MKIDVGAMLIALLLGLVMAAVAVAQRQPKTDPSQPANSSDQQSSDANQPAQEPGMSPEAELLTRMHMANQAEIKAGQLAESKGTTEAIRNFGTLLVRDHSYADKRISALAKQQGIQITQAPMPKSPEEQQKIEMQHQAMNGLEQSQGTDFDRRFIQFNVKAHQMAVNMVSSGSQQLKPSPVKSLTARMAPILKQHGEIAQHLQQREVASR